MGIVFNKKGRRKKTEEKLINEINDILNKKETTFRIKFEKENLAYSENDLMDILDKLNKDKIINDDLVETESINRDKDLAEKRFEDITDEINEEIISKKKFNPLIEEPLKTRSYNEIKTFDVGEIEEPKISNSNVFDDLDDSINDLPKEKGKSSDIVDINISNDTDVNETNNKQELKPTIEEDKEQTKMLVDTVLGGYEMLHDVAKHFVKYSDDKIREKLMNDEINLDFKLPLGEDGEKINAVEFISVYNEQAEEVVSYDKDLEKKVKPVMVRVFEKNGWKMTDESFLMIEFGKDLAQKTMQVYQLKKTVNQVLNMFTQVYTQEKARNRKQIQQQKEQTQNSSKPDSIVKLNNEDLKNINFEEE